MLLDQLKMIGGLPSSLTVALAGDGMVDSWKKPKRLHEFSPNRDRWNQGMHRFLETFCASFIDALIVLSITFHVALIPWPVRFGPIPCIILSVCVFVLVNMYAVYSHARFGATPGKWMVGIRVTRPDGRQIGWTEAWTGSSVDIVLAFIVLVFKM